MNHVFTLLIVMLSFKLHAGQEIGNGGGFCLFSDRNYYMYDQIITTKNPFGESRKGLTYAQNLQIIRTQLARLHEPHVKEFDLFITTLFTQKKGNLFQWLSRTNLPLMWEPDLETLLPRQCLQRRQAAMYFQSPSNFGGTIAIGFDAPLLAQIQNQPDGGLQLSYLIVHEWLWHFFSRTTYEKMATYNRLLQSQMLNTISEQEYQKIRSQLLGNTNNLNRR